MELKLHNTLTKTKDVFEPLDPKNVRMYVCGPTVYDYAHIGNARPAIVFDILFRLLRYIYGEGHVTYVRNVTDVDDKINARAAEMAEEKGASVEQARVELTRATYDQYQADVSALGCLPPTHQPRATENIREMIAMIEALIAAGHSYSAEGHVLFDVASKPDYGKLARRSLDEMIAGARVDVAPYKRNPMDFVLWKPSSADLPGWDSPWGRGRPGWHIECSAMSERLLGRTFDIHGGGIDLVFPHHENEIAQSEGAHNGALLARVWMHNGFLQVEGEKMSKSLGNFVTIYELLQREHPEVIRLQMLMTQYRQPIDWTEAGRHQARAILDRLYRETNAAEDEGFLDEDLIEPLLDDLNTPLAINLLTQSSNTSAVKAAARFLGFLNTDLRGWLKWQPAGKTIDEARIEALIKHRNEARARKDFKEADRIRAELDAMGVTLKDGPSATTWELKR